MTTTTEPRTSNSITFPTSHPDGNALASVDLSKSLEDEPTGSIQTLNVGPTRSSPMYDQHLRDRVGSSDSSDELRLTPITR
jgi:hypothetical protein